MTTPAADAGSGALAGASSASGPEALGGAGAEDLGLRMLAAAGVLGYLLWFLADSRTVNNDVFHAMALFRYALATGSLPTHDVFAYTPSIDPVVHHEWGTGAILWASWEGTGWGPAGLSVLRYGLLLLLLAISWSTARRRGATIGAAIVSAPVAVMLLLVGLSAVRGQLFTLVLLSTLIWFLDLHARGRRWWIPPWIGLCVVWVNLHAGYIVGIGGVALALADRPWISGAHAWWRDARGLSLLLVAMCGVLLLTPYGLAYPQYLARALTMPRPHVLEWLPLWAPQFRLFTLPVYGLSLLLVAYAIGKSGVRPGSGLPLVAVLAVAALFSVRHLSLYGVALFAWLAPALAGSELGALPTRWARRAPLLMTAVALFWCGAGAWKTYTTRAWRLAVPDRAGAVMVYPVRAAGYLRACGFSGNLLTGFDQGAYISWALMPRVRVSLDSRYEAAYAPGVFEEHYRFFLAQPGWQEVLRRYPTDAVLVPRNAPVAAAMQDDASVQESWPQVYGDEEYAIHLRQGSVPSCAGAPVGH